MDGDHNVIAVAGQGLVNRVVHHFEHRIQFILPAHGHVLGFARQAITQLKAHRLRREARIAAAMQALPGGTLQQWVERAYDDVPPRLWPVAARSLQAHVDHIRENLGA